MSAWTGRFSYEIQFEAADANEANEAMQRILDAETVFGFPITGRTGVYVAQIVPRDEDSNQDTDPAMNPVSPATVGEEEPGRKATGTGDVDTSAEKQRRSGSSTSSQESRPIDA